MSGEFSADTHVAHDRRLSDVLPGGHSLFGLGEGWSLGRACSIA